MASCRHAASFAGLGRRLILASFVFHPNENIRITKEPHKRRNGDRKSNRIFSLDFVTSVRYTVFMRIHLKIDYKETGKQCAAISTGLVLGSLAQLILEPQRVRPLVFIVAIIGALIWYIIAQYFFTR
jgi:hypothetical protein